MTLTTSKPWLMDAQSKGYAIGAFNANSLEQMQAIAAAAQDEAAPVVIQVSRRAAEYVGSGNRLRGLRMMAEMGRIASESVRVPIILHLDHGGEIDVLQALAVGFTSVMFDGGDLPYEENIAISAALSKQAHAADACFEAELGEVARVGTGEDLGGVPTDPAQVVDYVQRTGVDALAVSLGSVHGMQTKTAGLNLLLLDQIHAVVDVPLVLHGSSGVNDADVLQGIQRGLCKINIATQLNQAFTVAVRDVLTRNPNEVDPRKYLGPAREAMRQAVRERMRLIGVSGRAA